MTIPWWVAQHLVVTALLVAVVALACRLISNRPALEHAMWLVVLAKFMLPPLVAWPLSLPSWLAVESPAIERTFSSAEANPPPAQAISANDTATIEADAVSTPRSPRARRSIETSFAPWLQPDRKRLPHRAARICASSRPRLTHA